MHRNQGLEAGDSPGELEESLSEPRNGREQLILQNPTPALENNLAHTPSPPGMKIHNQTARIRERMKTRPATDILLIEGLSI